MIFKHSIVHIALVAFTKWPRLVPSVVAQEQQPVRSNPFKEKAMPSGGSHDSIHHGNQGNNGDVDLLSFDGHGGGGTLDNGIDPSSVVVDGLLDVDGNEGNTDDVDLLSFVAHGGSGTLGGILVGTLEDGIDNTGSFIDAGILIKGVATGGSIGTLSHDSDIEERSGEYPCLVSLSADDVATVNKNNMEDSLIMARTRKLVKKVKGVKSSKAKPAFNPTPPPVTTLSGLDQCIAALTGNYTFACCCDGGVYNAMFDCKGHLCSYREVELQPHISEEKAALMERSDCVFSGTFDAQEVIDPYTCEMKNEIMFIAARYDKPECDILDDEDNTFPQVPKDKHTTPVGVRFKHVREGDLELTFLRADTVPKQANATVTSNVGERRVQAVRYSSLSEPVGEEKESLVAMHRRRLNCRGGDCSNYCPLPALSDRDLRSNPGMSEVAVVSIQNHDSSHRNLGLFTKCSWKDEVKAAIALAGSIAVIALLPAKATAAAVFWAWAGFAGTGISQMWNLSGCTNSKGETQQEVDKEKMKGLITEGVDNGKYDQALKQYQNHVKDIGEYNIEDINLFCPLEIKDMIDNLRLVTATIDAIKTPIVRVATLKLFAEASIDLVNHYTHLIIKSPKDCHVTTRKLINHINSAIIYIETVNRFYKEKDFVNVDINNLSPTTLIFYLFTHNMTPKEIRELLYNTWWGDQETYKSWFESGSDNSDNLQGDVGVSFYYEHIRHLGKTLFVLQGDKSISYTCDKCEGDPLCNKRDQALLWNIDSTRLVSDKKPAQQSSTLCDEKKCYVASLAFNQFVGPGFVSETTGSARLDAVWYVDLINTVKIDHVDIISAIDGNEGLEGFEISFYLKNTKVDVDLLIRSEKAAFPGHHKYTQNSVSIVPFVVADRVQLESRSKLRIADVKVYGDVCGPERTNIALDFKSVGQSTTVGVHWAKKAVDGNVLPAREHLGTHTKEERSPFWHVTLPGNYLIDTVVVWRVGRTCDLCSKQKLFGPVGDQFVTGVYQTNFYLNGKSVLSSEVNYDSGGIDDSYTTISIDPPISADKVEIRAFFDNEIFHSKPQFGHLILGEVQVYGHRSNPQVNCLA